MAKFTRAEVRKIIGEACTDEIENAIIALHLGVVDPMKDELQNAKADAAKLATVQDELNTLKNEKTSGENYEALYKALKSSVEAEKETSAKQGALRQLLKKIGVAEKRIDTVIKCTDVANLKLTENGEIDGASDLEKTLKAEWADFIPTTETHGVETAKPPAATNVSRYNSKEEILKIKDTGERQRAIAENINLFQR